MSRWLSLLLILGVFACKDNSYIVLIDASGTNTLHLSYQQPAASGPAQEMASLLNMALGNEIEVGDSIPKISSGIRFEILAENDIDPLQSGIAAYQVKDKNLIIQGSDSTYLYYAIYEFLERELGFRWLDPQTDYIPELSEIRLPVNLAYAHSPEIATRTVHARTFYEHPDFARKLHVTSESFPYYAPQARVHTFHRFLPRDIFFAEHPDYYALRNDRRITTQLCLTNSRVLQIVIDSVQAHFDRDPQAKVVSVSQDDNTQYCTCIHCAEADEHNGGPGGTMINFVNMVAKQFPDKIISTLAYQYTRKPGTVKPASNVLVTLCSIECDRSGSIESKCSAFADDLKGWNALGSTLRIWDYTTQFTNFLAPFPNFRTLQPNVQFFRDNQTKWVFEQHSHQPSDLFEMRTHLMAKLLWNPDSNVDSLMEDFANYYYNQAAEFILSYNETIHDELEKDSSYFLFLYGDPSQAFSSFLGADKLSLYHQYFEKAASAVNGNEELIKRLRKARVGLDYATLEAYRKNLSPEFSLLNERGQLNSKFQTTFDRFKQTCKENNITMMNEMRYTVAEYIDGWDKTITRASKTNEAKGKQITLLTAPKKYADEDPQVLTDGAFGGANFYANWLGFEGNHMEAVLDLGNVKTISFTGIAFLQVVNHLVFLPQEVIYSYALEDKQFKPLGKVTNTKFLTPESKINDIEYFDLSFNSVKARYLKIKAVNLLTPPDWHHGAGLPAWIFADEWIVH